MTGDSQLKPYTSWVDFVQHLKHPNRSINFIAAYGTHDAHHGADVDTLATTRGDRAVWRQRCHHDGAPDERRRCR